MKTEKIYTSLDEIFNDAKSHQVTGQELINGRSRVLDEWQEIKLSDELNEQIIDKIVSIFGGRITTQSKVRRALNYGFQHWALQRVLLVKYGEKPAYLSYCAGQDQTWETAKFRKDVLK